MIVFRNGTKVRLVQSVDRYPSFIAPAGATGVVVDDGADESGLILSVLMDEPLEGAEHWGNEVLWANDDDPRDDLEEIL